MMKWQMSYNEEENILYVKTHGVLNITSASAMRNEGAEILKKNNCTRCLLDHSELEEDELATLDIYNLPKRYEELGISRTMRMALVVPEEFMKNLKFYETICRNNGYFVSIFFKREEALVWLKQ